MLYIMKYDINDIVLNVMTLESNMLYIMKYGINYIVALNVVTLESNIIITGNVIGFSVETAVKSCTSSNYKKVCVLYTIMK